MLYENQVLVDINRSFSKVKFVLKYQYSCRQNYQQKHMRLKDWGRISNTEDFLINLVSIHWLAVLRMQK